MQTVQTGKPSSQTEFILQRRVEQNSTFIQKTHRKLKQTFNYYRQPVIKFRGQLLFHISDIGLNKS